MSSPVVPKTWAELRARCGLGSDSSDSHDNILAGAAFIQELQLRLAGLSRHLQCRAFTLRETSGDGPTAAGRNACVCRDALTDDRGKTGARKDRGRREVAQFWAGSPLFAAQRERHGGRPADAWHASSVRTVVDLSVLILQSGNLFVRCQRDPIAMIQIALHRSLSGNIAPSDARQGEHGQTSRGWQGKSADIRRAHVVGWIEHSRHWDNSACWLLQNNAQRFLGKAPSPRFSLLRTSNALSVRDDEINVRPGRIRHGNQGVKRPKSFVGQVLRAVRKAGYTDREVGRGSGSRGRSTFGRGRRAALFLASRSPGRRVVIITRIIHRGVRFSPNSD
jgi:hypothetical protein